MNTKYDWTEERTVAPMIPAGYHRVTISKVFTADKEGNCYEREGNRRILVVVESASGEEAMSNFDIEGKFDWTLRNLVQIADLDVQRMNDEGVTPESFLDQSFAEAQLKGRKFWAEITHKASNGQTYCNWKPVRDADVPAHALPGAKPSSIDGPGKRGQSREMVPAGDGFAPITDEDIPF